jgi:hypothetical protein
MAFISTEHFTPVIGQVGFAVLRGGFCLEGAWASTLRLIPGRSSSTVQNAFRTTFSLADTTRAASRKDSLMDLRPLGGTFGNIASFLGKLDLSPMLLCQLLSVERSSDEAEAANGTFVCRYIALPESPTQYFIGSADLYSRLGQDRFEPLQWRLLAQLTDVRRACVGALRRLHTLTNMGWLDFVFGILWLLPFFTQFCVSAASVHENFATEEFTWADLKTSDTWMVGFFLSLPPQAREVLGLQIFAQSLDGEAKRVLEVVLRKIEVTDRSYNVLVLAAIQSSFVQPSVDMASLDDSTIGAAALQPELIMDFITATGIFISSCEKAIPACALLPQRKVFWGTPPLSQRLRAALTSAGRGAWCSDDFASCLLAGAVGNLLGEPAAVGLHGE